MNKHSRYLNVFTIKIFCFGISISMGNPMWFFYELKHFKDRENK